MAASPPTSRPDPSAAVMRIALQVGATPVAHVDIGTMLSGVCSALPPAVGVAAAVLVLSEPADPRDPEGRQVFGSDDAAHRLGLIQHRAGRGPVPAAVRGDRPLVVPDLTVSGPPELAAAAADCGLVRSLVVPLTASGQSAGGLQLLGGADAGPDERTASMLWPLVSVLAARLADARELARVSARVVDDAVEDEAPEVPPETTAVPAAAGAERTAPEPPDGDAIDRTTARLHPVTPADRATGEPTTVAPAAEQPATERYVAVPPAPVLTERDPFTDVFAGGDAPDETPPAGQVRLGWEGPEHTPRPTALPARALPARIPVLGRTPRPAPRPVPAPVPAAVPEQRSGPIPTAARPTPAGAESTAQVAAAPSVPDAGVDGVDDPTWRVPRHRLRDDA